MSLLLGSGPNEAFVLGTVTRALSAHFGVTVRAARPVVSLTDCPSLHFDGWQEFGRYVYDKTIAESPDLTLADCWLHLAAGLPVAPEVPRSTVVSDLAELRATVRALVQDVRFNTSHRYKYRR